MEEAASESSRAAPSFRNMNAARPDRDRLVPRRRKIALACEPCRERKSRCDGTKPICSACQRRGIPLEQCLYTVDNARTASNESYIKVLHDRIRLLESKCRQHGIAVPPLDPREGEASFDSSERQSREVSATPVHDAAPDPAATPFSGHSVSVISQDVPDVADGTLTVTAMGAISTEEDVHEALVTTDEFFGSSSAASFMDEVSRPLPSPHSLGSPSTAVASPFPRPRPVSRTSNVRNSLPIHIRGADADKFALPPRAFADHLLSRFWDRVYHLYPFFHRISFERTYENLWLGRTEEPPAQNPKYAHLGLGSSAGAGAGSIVFQVALNAIFAIGTHFSDLPPNDKLSTVQTFFKRAKTFVSIDFLEMNSLAVVQTLLLMATLLQSTPFPHRCWNAVGIACRVGEGIGLHAESSKIDRGSIEFEIRRRTWHACVMFDDLVSMTYGRPTMTSNIPRLPPPSAIEDDSRNVSTFFIEYVRLSKILGDVLQSVYQPSYEEFHLGVFSASSKKVPSLDLILELDSKFVHYEATVDPLLSWKTPLPGRLEASKRLIIEQQRTVLYGRFLYLRFMLHRSVLTHLRKAAHLQRNGHPDPAESVLPPTLSKTFLTKFALEGARICLEAALDLLDLVHETYRTPKTGGWWWDGFYTCSATLALIVGHLLPNSIESLDKGRIAASWDVCQEILGHFATFSIPAEKSLKMLRRMRDEIVNGIISDSPPAPVLPPNPGLPSTGNTEFNTQMLNEPYDFNLDMGFGYTDAATIPDGAFGWDLTTGFIADGFAMDIIN